MSDGGSKRFPPSTVPAEETRYKREGVKLDRAARKQIAEELERTRGRIDEIVAQSAARLADDPGSEAYEATILLALIRRAP